MSAIVQVQFSVVERIGVAGGAVGAIIAVAVLWFLLQVLRENGQLMLRLDAVEAAAPPAGFHQFPPSLRVGDPAPSFSLRDLAGEIVTLDDLRAAGRPVVLVFTDPNNPYCTLMTPDLARWQRAYGDRLTIAVISRGTVEANRAEANLGLSRVLLQRENEVFAAYHLYSLPSALVVRPDGSVGHALVPGVEPIRLMLATAMRAPG